MLANHPTDILKEASKLGHKYAVNTSIFPQRSPLSQQTEPCPSPHGTFATLLLY